MFLRYDELAELTGRKHHKAQASALRSMGIEHRVRPDGTVAALRSHVESVLSGVSSATTRKRKKTEPNWDAIRNAA